MKVFKIPITKLSSLFVLNLCLSLTAAAFTPMERKINISGLINDSETFLPLTGVSIYDRSNNLLAVTDSRGYFNISFLVDNKEGEIFFNLLLKKEGYHQYLQKEHWGNLEGDINAIYYFGIKNSNDGLAKAYSQVILGNHVSSFEEVEKGLSSVIDRIKFERTITSLKDNNDYLFFETDKGYYLLNEGGWIEVDSPNVNILIDGGKKVVAKEVNNCLNRSEVKRMSTIKQDDVSVAIFTH